MVNRLKASLELSLLIAVMSLFLVFIGIYSVTQLRVINRNSETLFKDRMLPMDQLGDIRYYTSSIFSTVHKANDEKVSFNEANVIITAAQDSINSNWKSYKLTYLTTEEQLLANKISQEMKGFNSSVEKLKSILQQNDKAALRLTLKTELSQDFPIVHKVNELLALQVKIADSIYKENERNYKNNSIIVFSVLLAVLTFVIPFSYNLVKRYRKLITIYNLNRVKVLLSEDNYRNLIEFAGEAIVIANETAEIIDLNEKACELFGYSREELLFMNISDLVPENELTEHAEILKKVRKDNQLISSRTIKRKDGSLLDAEISARLIDDRGFFAIIRDITDRKRFEEQQALIVSIVNSSEDAIISKTLEGIITSWNKGAEKLLGYSAEEILGKHITTLIPMDLRSEEVHIMNSIREGKSFNHYETKRLKKNGEPIYVSLRVSPMRDSSGKIIGASKIIRDVTDRKNFEDELIRYNTELQKTNAELDRFVYSTSHDLRAPLKSMLGLINITKETLRENNDCDVSEVTIERLNMLDMSVKKLDNFIGDILTYSRNARMEPQLEEINLEELVNDVKSNLNFVDSADKIDFTLNTDCKSKFVSDYKRLSVVLNNILYNAYKYHDSEREKPFVHIKVACNDECAVIVVEDNGIGISEEDKEKIFDMFYRSTSLSTGSGLGLYIAKETLEKIEGTIKVESELNVGTSFIIEVPNKSINQVK